MEEQIVRLLADTQQAAEATRKGAEAQLQSLYPDPAFPLALVSIGAHKDVPLNIRQSSLLSLKTYIQSSWSPQIEEYKGRVFIDDEVKKRLRSALLELATSEEDRKIKNAAGYGVSKIASADFPEEWPDLFPTLMHLIQTGSDAQVHGALKVLVELVDDGLNDTQFFAVARDLVKTVQTVAINEQRKPTLRALAVSVFRGCFDILEMVLDEHKAEVKAFAEEVLKDWIPFFIEVVKAKLPPPPSEDDEVQETGPAEQYRGLVALKMQIVKVLMRIKSLFSAVLSPQSTILFSITWDELHSLQAAYHQMYIEDERQSRLEDADGLPYTLDFLVLEELDFMQACLRAPPVRKELEQQLQVQAAGQETWMTQVMQLAVAYAHITTEEEGLWRIDVNIFLSEETSVTANYTPRTACGDLVIKLGEWQTQPTLDGLLSYTRNLYSTTQSWKAKEAALYILNQLLGDFQDVEKTVSAETANGFLDFIKYAMAQEDEFLRARGYLVAGSLVKTSGDALQQPAAEFLQACLQAITNDDSEVVKVSCIRALQHHLSAVPPAVSLPLQNSIITALSHYLSAQDLRELIESDDLMVTLVETLRDAILLDTRVCLTGSGLDLLFTIASHGATNFNVTSLATETFEEIAVSISTMGGDSYAQLCAKVLPSLTGAFDVGSLTDENALTNLAADLLDVLTEFGTEPLPPGFAATVMPKLQGLLLGSLDSELLKSGTSAVKNLLVHDYGQLFAWRSPAPENKSGLEVVLMIIDRLLSPTIDDIAAAEVGGLAAEVVEKAGSERLGPYLEQLLRAVAARLSTATQVQFVQSLIGVFARLSLRNASDVVGFLSNVRIGEESGLQVVMGKWLENSNMFAGYDEIRQK